LSFDSFSCVRQDAVNSLIDLSEIVHLSIFDSKLTLRLERFSFDQNVILLNFYRFKLIHFYLQEDVRTLALSAAISILKIFDVSYNKQIILPIILNFINDPSWKIRLLFIKHVVKVIWLIAY